MDFEIAAGSITGTDHILRSPDKKHILKTVNCQDSFYYQQDADRIVAVVCDGCGGSEHSEVGAKLGAHYIIDSLMRYRIPPNFSEHNFYWVNPWADVHQFLKRIASDLSGRQRLYDEIVEQFLLFTIIGTVITPDLTIVFTRGDGGYQVNNDIQILSQNNRPDYLGYSLISDAKYSIMPKINLVEQTSKVDKIILSTDGAEHLLGDGGVDTLQNDELTWANPDHLRRQLILGQKVNPELYHDDTTLLMIRRKT